MNEIVKKNGVNFGLISGFISVLITTAVYATNLEFFTKWWLGLIMIGISLSLSIMLMLKTKKEVKEHFNFKNAFTTYFIYTLIAIVISVLFNIVLFNFIDVNAKETIKELTIRFSMEVMERFNTPKEVMQEALEKMENQDQFGITEQIKGLFISLSLSSIFGLILAAIFKTKSTNQGF
jgi:hypothetical protein